MVRHFESKHEAIDYRDKEREKGNNQLKVYKKLKGHSNRIKKPFVCCSEIEWLNYY